MEVITERVSNPDLEVAQMNCLRQLVGILRNHDYGRFQYVPTRKSPLGIFKELENLTNLVFKRKHLLFYFSIFPNFYIRIAAGGNKQNELLFRFFFENQPIRKPLLENSLPMAWIESALKAGIISLVDDKFFAAFCVVPFQHFFLICDIRKSYEAHQLYEDTQIENRVWIGSDSAKFAALNLQNLKGRTFKHALELGSGTGVQLLSLSNICKKLTAVDINPKAVKYTDWNSRLNDISHLKALHSNLYEKLDDKYDLILANPWFIDLDKAGMEEIPDIFNQLDAHLTGDGIFVMIFGSFVKTDGHDVGISYLLEFARKNNYDVNAWALGKGIERRFLDRYKRNNLSHSVLYYAQMQKGGTGKIKVIPASLLRRLRDNIYLKIVKAIHSLT